ncbi:MULTISPECIES: hypothetical protein [Methylococcus]|uniref:Uncharacterized protein n=1 Tax=Methylococcus capsulatus TaxID=414 RepID=A0ABZ2F255_METCP|nr:MULTISPECIES: hypothetical protein [Methylococcus]MDF9391741.1 hypothetical protein [Methylococcus capsulatus]
MKQAIIFHLKRILMDKHTPVVALLLVLGMPAHASIEGQWLCKIKTQTVTTVHGRQHVSYDKSVAELILNEDGSYTSTTPVLRDFVMTGHFKQNGFKFSFRPNYEDLIFVVEEGCRQTGMECKVYGISGRSKGKITANESRCQ